MSDERPCGIYKGVWIPGCMGGAVYGRTGCTCKRPRKSPRPSEEPGVMLERIKRLERRVARLEAAMGGE